MFQSCILGVPNQHMIWDVFSRHQERIRSENGAKVMCGSFPCLNSPFQMLQLHVTRNLLIADAWPTSFQIHALVLLCETSTGWFWRNTQPLHMLHKTSLLKQDTQQKHIFALHIIPLKDESTLSKFQHLKSSEWKALKDVQHSRKTQNVPWHLCSYIHVC